MRVLAEDRVRLRVDEVERLLDVEARAEVEREVLAGAPVLAPVLAALGRPEVAVRSQVATPGSVVEHRVHATPEVAALLVTGRDDRHPGETVELRGLHPAAVPSLLAGLVGLGPHRSSRDVADVDAAVVDDLLASDDLLRSSALQVVGADRAWSVEVLAGRRDARTLSVVDGPGGLASLVLEQDRWRLRPTTSTEVFRTFTTVYA